jgi:hypothetical protein
MFLNKTVSTKWKLCTLLLLLFAFNIVETQLEDEFKSAKSYEMGYQIAHAFFQLEGSQILSAQETFSKQAILGFSISYFLVFPALLLIVTLAFILHADISRFRVWVTALILNYALSLPFFLFFPVPERWAYPQSEGILLSDLLTTRLIEAIRPMSGLDNSFPSVHVS